MKIAIVGNGVSAITAVREIRKTDGSIGIDVFSDEPYAYYPRPKLIDYIAGRTTEEAAIQYGPEWYESQGVKLHLSKPVTGVKPDTRQVVADGRTYSDYGSILLACGSRPFVPPIRGVEKRRVHTIRTLSDAVVVKQEVRANGREVVVGGGILGIELAAALKEIGGNPIVISNITQLLPAQLDQGASDVLMGRLKKLGLEILLDFTCQEVTGDEAATGVRSTMGEEIRGDLVLMATGVKPSKDLAAAAGIECGRGVKVDAHMQTSASGIFAAGDCTEWNGVSLGIIPVALDTAKVAARNMLKYGTALYDGTVRSNTLQVVGIDLTSVGFISPNSPEYESTVIVDESRGTYFKAVTKNHVVVGGIALGDRRVALRLRQLMTNKTNVSGLGDGIFKG